MPPAEKSFPWMLLKAWFAKPMAMTHIGDYLYVQYLQVSNRCPHLIGNLKHTPPQVLGLRTDTQKQIGAAVRRYFACACSLELRDISASIVEDVKRLEVCKNLRRNWEHVLKLTYSSSQFLSRVTEDTSHTTAALRLSFLSQESPMEAAKTGVLKPYVQELLRSPRYC